MTEEELEKMVDTTVARINALYAMALAAAGIGVLYLLAIFPVVVIATWRALL